MMWPETIINDLQSASGSVLEPGSFEQMVRLMGSGLHVSSTFSGMGGDVTGVLLLEKALQRRGDLPQLSPPARRIAFNTATDI
eukprot:4827486-Lingulodinium_polyedra.AAC.1